MLWVILQMATYTGHLHLPPLAIRCSHSSVSSLRFVLRSHIFTVINELLFFRTQPFVTAEQISSARFFGTIHSVHLSVELMLACLSYCHFCSIAATMIHRSANCLPSMARFWTPNRSISIGGNFCLVKPCSRFACIARQMIFKAILVAMVVIIVARPHRKYGFSLIECNKNACAFQ